MNIHLFGISGFPELNPLVLSTGMSDVLKALILGIIQGLTEYLPVSSSGHLEIGKKLMGFGDTSDLVFPILVHAATALSSVIVFYKEIIDIFKGLFKFRWNEATIYSAKLILSSVPVVIIGLMFQDEIKDLFRQNMLLVGCALIANAGVLMITFWAKDQQKNVGWLHAAVLGVAQAIAIIPGISRSGSTIASALMMGVNRAKAAQFSFLMVIIPILGKATLDTKDWLFPGEEEIAAQAAVESLSPLALGVGFLAAFITGLLACRIMLNLVRNGKIYWFSIYCLIVGIIAVATHFSA